MSEGRALSFGSVAELYDAYRPAPPAALANEIGSLAGRDLLELAAGTGLCTRFLLSLGARMTIIEPDDAMRAVLVRQSPQVRALRARADHLPFPDASFDVIVTSSAWHWFKQPESTDEVARVLRDDGQLWVMGNGFDRSHPWLVELLKLRDAIEQSDEGTKAHDLSFVNDERFADESSFTVRWEWPRDVESIVQLFHTYSGVIRRSPEDQAHLDDVVRKRLGVVAPHGVLTIPMSVRGVRVTRRAR